MKLDFKSLAFGYSLLSGTSTPAWETALGQSEGYKIRESDSINELIKGLVYKAVPADTIKFKKGKGGAFVVGDQPEAALVIAAVFDKVYINDTLIENGKFVLLIAKDTADSHKGRLKLKYGVHNTFVSYDGTVITNQEFIDLVKTQLNLSDDACWFVYDISVKDQDKLILNTVIVNENASEVYADAKAHHAAWDVLIPEIEDEEPPVQHEETFSFIEETKPVISEEDFVKWLSEKINSQTGEHLSVGYQESYHHILCGFVSIFNERNIFEITDLVEFDEYEKRVRENPVFESVNSIGSGTPSSALTNYRQYLEDRAGNILSESELVEKLREWYNKKPIKSNATSTLVGFGMKFGKSIKKNNITASKLLQNAGIESTMGAYIDRGVDLYLSLADGSGGYCLVENNSKTVIQNRSFDFNAITGAGVNCIFYGTPGCGKSYHIEHDILGKDEAGNYTGEYSKENIIRTTFYLDYTNTDFVGQILPKVTGDKVEYVFNPGPFTLALIQAIKNPEKKVALVIEEINRGNAPAIFGDIFQLLDRDENHVSEYGIKNVGIIDYLNSYNFGGDYNEVRYSFDEIKLPGNLYIYATMNSSDQNVFTLDTAFTRRWDRNRMPNEFTSKCGFKDYLIPGMEAYTWQTFVESINAQIRKNIDNLQVNEDKQIGVYFVNKHMLVESGVASKDKVETFAYKVLEYLWSDVSKLDHEIIFHSFDTFEDVVKAYKTKGVEVFNQNIFKDVVIRTEESEESDE